MARKVEHYLRAGLGCPNCGEHRMHKLHSWHGKIEPPNPSGPTYEWGYHCVTCDNQYVTPPLSSLPPIAQNPLRNLIGGLLHYTDAASGTSVDMARGAVTGVATTLMEERGIPLEKALVLIKDALPRRYRPETIPDNWLGVMERLMP